MALLKTESYRKGVFYSTGLNIIARGIGFINTLIIAYYFGANASTDIYFLVLSVAMIITSIINGNDYLVLIPEAMKLRERESEKASQKFLNFFLYGYSLIGLLLVGLILVSPVFFYSIFSKFNVSVLLQNNKILYAGSIIILFQLLNNFLNAILSSYKFFTAPIITGLINSLFSISVTVLFHKQLGIVGTISGIAIGYILNFVLLIFLLRRFQKWDFFHVAWMRDKTVWANIGLMQINIVPLWVRNSLGLYLLSGFGKGIITSLNLGQQMAYVPEILIINQFTAIAGIKFNELHAQKKDDEANSTFLRLSKMGLTFTIAISAVLFLLSDKIIGLFYSKTAITADSLKNISIVFGYMILFLPFKFIDALTTNIFTAYQKIKATIRISFITHSIVTIIFFFLVRSFGLTGYIMGVGLHFSLLFCLFYPLFKRTLSFVKYRIVFLFFVKTILLTSIVFTLTYFIIDLLLHSIHNNFITIICGLFVYFSLLVGINELTGINEFLKIRRYKRFIIQRFFF